MIISSWKLNGLMAEGMVYVMKDVVVGEEERGVGEG